MAKKGQSFRSHSLEFKKFVVELRVSGKVSLKKVCRLYQLNSENVIKWTRRFLAGEPLVMKRGRRQKNDQEQQSIVSPTKNNFEVENEKLKMELAYKNEVIKILEARVTLKKKINSPLSDD